MNKSKKITLTFLGIAASVGLGSLIAAHPWATHTGRCWERMAEERTLIGSRNIDRPVTITVCPTPAPEKPLQEGYRRVKCKRCGQEYDAPNRFTFVPTDEEEKHHHITPEERARFQKAALRLLDEYRGKP